MQWQWVDLAILAIIALSVLTGVVRGFVKELIGLFVWVVAIWLAFTYSPRINFWLQNYIHDKTARTVVAFIVILIAVLLAGSLVNALLSFIMKRSGLSGTDRLLGVGFGFIRGVFLVALIMVAIKIMLPSYEKSMRSSQLYQRFDPVVDWLYGFIPEFIQKGKALENQSTSL